MSKVIKVYSVKYMEILYKALKNPNLGEKERQLLQKEYEQEQQNYKEWYDKFQ